MTLDETTGEEYYELFWREVICLVIGSDLKISTK